MNINKVEDDVVDCVTVQDVECIDDNNMNINKVEDDVVDCVESRMRSVLIHMI